MLNTRKNSEQNKGRMVVGVDLSRYSLQISYMRPGMEAPETAEQVMGSEVFNIPMVLCKREGVNQWFYGREALRYHEKEGGTLVDSILQKAIDGEPQIIEGDPIDPTALLTLFIKRSLSILGGAHVTGAISDIMFTCEDLGTDVIGVMGNVAANLSLNNCNIYFQSYAESIYNYMIHQDPEIWMHSVKCVHFDGRHMVCYTFRRNPRTTPIVTFVDTGESMPLSLPQIITEDARAAAYAKFDEKFASVMNEEMGAELYSAVYLLGDGFKDDWASQSLRLLGRNRRLFVGNDLFSRGACYSLMDKYEPTEASQAHVFLGPDKLRSNIGIEVIRRGEDSYLALLDAGLNWYDVHAEYELFMPEDHEFRFVIIPLNGGEHTEHVITIDDAPDRDPDTLRMLITMSMSDVNTVDLHIKDLGFGEMYPGSEKEWDYQIEV